MAVQALTVPRDLSGGEPELWAWYGNITKELDYGHLSMEEAAKVREYYEEAGLLTAWKVDFFRRHFCETFARASRFLLGGGRQLHILDLGCGTGSQAIYLALMGARITGVDMDGSALEILRKRKALYENLSGKQLEIELIERSVFDIDYQSLEPIDGVYSMFAFNMMQPSGQLLSALLPGFSKRARIAIIDGNNSSWLPMMVPSRRRAVWSPKDFARNLQVAGFEVYEHEGGISVPPPLWRALPTMMRQLDSLLNKYWFFPISHQIMAERRIEG